MMMIRCVFGVLLAIPALQGLAPAQCAWKQLEVASPTSRVWAAMTHDTFRGRTVLFGGLQGGLPLADTWEWDGNTWQQVAPAIAPTARKGHALAFDSVRGKVVLFGSTNSVSDTWEWDGTTWTLRATTGPSPRLDHAMAFDSLRARTVLFGGRHPNFSPAYSDTWEWDGNAWVQVSTSGPGVLTSHAMAYDSLRGVTVMFGGNSGSGYSATTWAWNGSSWSLVASSGPLARANHAMCFDTARGVVTLFGGLGSSGTLTDTWTWDGATWAQAASPGPAANPTASINGMAYDTQRATAVVLGPMWSAPIPTSAHWSWFDPPAGSATAFGSSCGSPALAMPPSSAAPPTIGATAYATLTSVPSPLAFVSLGWSRTFAGPFLLPVPLDGYGMIGCQLHQSAEVIGGPATPSAPGSATYGLAIPFDSNLLGVHLYLQGWAVAPGMNPANIITSNALDWTFGY